MNESIPSEARRNPFFNSSRIIKLPHYENKCDVERLSTENFTSHGIFYHSERLQGAVLRVQAEEADLSHGRDFFPSGSKHDFNY